MSSFDFDLEFFHLFLLTLFFFSIPVPYVFDRHHLLSVRVIMPA